MLKLVWIFLFSNAALLTILRAFSRLCTKRTVAMTRFDSCIPAMWRCNKVTFFLFVRLLRDHPEDTGGITSQGWETLGFNTCICARERRNERVCASLIWLVAIIRERWRNPGNNVNDFRALPRGFSLSSEILNLINGEIPTRTRSTVCLRKLNPCKFQFSTRDQIVARAKEQLESFLIDASCKNFMKIERQISNKNYHVYIIILLLIHIAICAHLL